uniref:Immunoglobulin V-set domain-containing protein n=1 Tax=Sander lucioperca TaxID=283035 RepID=A0A8C9ZXR4_SANLU
MWYFDRMVCLLFTEPSAVTPVFVQKGEDVLLNVTIADVPKEDSVIWKFNKTVNLVRFLSGNLGTKVSDDYSGRIELLEKFSVKLKNLQEADGGVYTVLITVQVSPVNLTVDSVSNSSDWCNLTVSCRAQDSHINSTFRCDTHTCSQEGGERSQVTPSAADLHVYLSSGFIMCNHSNQVSWKKDMKTIKNVCPRHAGKTERLNYKQLMNSLKLDLENVTDAVLLLLPLSVYMYVSH